MAYNPIIDSTRFIKNLQQLFGHSMCFNKNITDLVSKYRIEFAFALSYIYTEDTKESLLPAWILNTFPKVEDILTYLRATNCQHTNCEYCTTKLSSVSALRKYFSYEQFREFDGVKLQEEAVNSAINNQSLIAVFPTGGGKSLTFQLPALIHGEHIGGLTVVISPLQSLMKDQVDNLLNKNITNAAYMNGLLNPIERKDVIERVYSGDVNILYISPEALRSRTILNLLTKRQIVRFVIDEAHCFSTWGHDFRPDYLYIADFIKTLVERKQITRMIPVSCFTATAKYDVIKDIKDYFKDKLNLDLTVFKTTKGRTNLEYKVIQIGEDEDRYIALRNILEAHKIPTIIYASRTQVIDSLYEKLINDGFKTSKFHGGMDTEDKINQQNKFMSDETNIMVSTNAFGMGVDKSDVGVVVHYKYFRFIRKLYSRSR